MKPEPSSLRDYASRTKASSPLGTTLFVSIRLLGPVLAYAILTRGLGSGVMNVLGVKTFSYGASNSPTELSFGQWVIFLMSAGSCLKHIYWVLAVSEQEIPPGTGIFFGALETIIDSLNSLLFMHNFPSRCISQPAVSKPGPQTILALSLYITGLLVETSSEIQRRNYKRAVENRGKPYSGGLFSLARNINYGGHVLWKTGNSLASAGWVWAAIVGGLQLHDFVTRGVPVLDHYCEKRASQSGSSTVLEIRLIFK